MGLSQRLKPFWAKPVISMWFMAKHFSMSREKMRLTLNEKVDFAWEVLVTNLVGHMIMMETHQDLYGNPVLLLKLISQELFQNIREMQFGVQFNSFGIATVQSKTYM